MSESLGSRPISGTADRALADIVAEITDRLHAGKDVNIDEFITLHPEFADRLQTILPSLELLHTCGSIPCNDSAAEPSHGTLGDFRILREVGRGGMGIVYEAEQVSLHRRVALKVLPLAGAMDARQLQRFKNESLAAAQLHHTNIVPVYYVGCERGVHFYAMQFIEGQGLADVIAELRDKEKNVSRKAAKDAKEDIDATPDFAPSRLCVSFDSHPESAEQTTKPIAAISTIRSTTDSVYYRVVAELGIQAAEALDYAHENGIIHRDIKPANLLVESSPLVPPGRGVGGEGLRLWITDFGLAQVQGDARMTMTGDLVGTLRYMSPEQALAKRVVVDHRTDIYSLGATLYELLICEPAFAGTDRQELLRQIAFEEPRPPRRLNRAIPAELETIVLKALEKNPADRYGTAKELVDDLRRFVMDEPIRAKRPGVVQRLRKWGTRHRALVASGVICLFVVAIVMAISTVLIWRKQQETDSAYQIAKDQRQEADKQRNEAIASLKDAQAAVDQLLYRVGTQTLGEVPQMERVRREVLTDALGFYKRLLEREHAGTGLRLQTARAWIHAGEVHLMLGDATQAEESIRQGIAVAEELLRQEPVSSEYRQVLAEGWIYLSQVHIQINQLAEAEKALETARKTLVNLVTETPSSEHCLVKLTRTCGDLGTVYARGGKLTLAERWFREALRWGEQGIQAAPDNLYHQQTLATVEGNLGKVLDNLDRPEEGGKLLSQAVQLQEKLVTREPSTTHRSRLANLYRDVGLRQSRLSQLKEAAATHQKAVDLWSQVHNDFPHVPDHAQSYALVLLFAGKDLMALGRDRPALDRMSEAERLYERLANDFPKIKDYAQKLAWCCADRAWLLAASNNPEVRNPAVAIAPAKKAVELIPEDSKHWIILGVAYYRTEQWQAALPAFVEAGKRPAAAGRIDLYFLAMTHWKLGNKDEARKSYGQAETWRLQHLPAKPAMPGIDRQAAELLGIGDQQP
jgi:serine/threonine protein kinase/tetratricopeptide (TPR) repeat protein